MHARKNVAAIQSRQSLEPKAKIPLLFVLASQKERSFMPTKPVHGTTFMSVLKSKESISKKPIRSTEPAPIGLKSTSAASAALKSASTIILRAGISSATRKKVRGGKITGG